MLALVDPRFSLALGLTRVCMCRYSLLILFGNPPIQAPISSNSFGAGHAGVAMDVQLLQQGWLEARGADSVMYAEVRWLLALCWRLAGMSEP